MQCAFSSFPPPPPTPTLSDITGGVPNGGGQINSTFEPRVIQFGLKILY
jgi:hypothetical protein